MAWFLLLLHLFLFHFPYFSSSFNFSCHHDESSALLQFKSSFTIHNYDLYGCDESLNKTATWKNGTDCCSSWHGVTCDTVSGHVIGLNLRCEGLTGEIPTQISHLSKLQSLHLSQNDELVWKETNLKRLLQNATDLRELRLDGTDMSSIRPNSIELLFNRSSSLVTLNLAESGLSGKFKGEIPLSFSNLTHLTSLSLSSNYLNGSIPSSLLTLPRLTFLYLDDNELSGQIPNAFQMSNKFQELDFNFNKIEGELPSSLSNLQHLIHLDLGWNSFRGQIPYSLFNLTQLVRLDCSHNKLEGPIPNKITGFQKLVSLDLSDNLLNGTIPSSVLTLPSLEYLYLSNNRLTGNIPKSIFNLTNLHELDLSSNNLSGVVNFQLFSKLPNLSFLSLSWNTQLSLNFQSNVNYTFPNLLELYFSSINLIEFHKLKGEFSNLDDLDLSNNKLNGRIPNCLLENNSLSFLNLSQNLFTSIDQWINVNTSNGYLSSLDLSDNLLNGEIPLAVCNISSLVFLNLGYNNLTGIIPQCLAESPSLEVLNLQMNNFHGTLPSNFSKDCIISMMNLYGNQLEGHFPKSLSHCKNLKFLNLGSNKIEDNFPDWLQTMHDLKVLVLRDNKLHGPVVNLKIKHIFPSLIIFDISGNNFSGFLSKAYLKFFEAMKNVIQVVGDSSFQYLYTYYPTHTFDWAYTDSVTVTTKGTKMTLVKIPKKFVSIDMSRNKFEGEIPNAIGELHALIGLNLSHNRLTGHIPQSMGNLSNLESLDLSSNMLTGMIPAELTNLDFLEVLNLSNNHLVGKIPQGPHFNTFTNDSFDGNLGLCGFPLSKICGPEQHSPPSPNNFCSEEKFGFGWKPVAIGYGCGFVIGIGIGYYMFLIGKPRWLVMIFGGQPKRRVKRGTRMRRNHGTIVNQTQMVQMS